MVRLIAIQVLYSYLQAHLDLQTMYNLIYLGVFRFLSMGFAMVFITNPNEWRRAAREFTESYAYLVRVQDGVLCYAYLVRVQDGVLCISCTCAGWGPMLCRL